MNPIFLTRPLLSVSLKTKGLFVICGLLVGMTCLSTTSCGTAHGFGSDVKTAGRGVEHAGEATGRGIQHAGEKIREKTR